jgi:hypothetical protein
MLDFEITEVKMGRTYSTDGETRNIHRIFARKSLIRKPLGRQRRRWEVH